MSFDSETVELELNCKDGSTVWAETSITFLDEAYGRRREILGVIRNITARTSKADGNECLAAGCTDCIAKPIMPQNLITKTNQYAVSTLSRGQNGPLRKKSTDNNQGGECALLASKEQS